MRTKLNWKLVEVNKGGGDVLPGPGAFKDPGRKVLDILEPVQGFVRNSAQNSVAVVPPGGNERVDKLLSNFVSELRLELGNVFEVQKGIFVDVDIVYVEFIARMYDWTMTVWGRVLRRSILFFFFTTVSATTVSNGHLH